MNERPFAMIKGIAAFAAAAITLAACASSPAADERIAVAKASLQRAETSGAPELAPVEIAEARDKLAHAEQANAAQQFVPATQLAEQANVDAQLAEATAQRQHAHKAATEFDASMSALRQESLRSSPPAQ